MVTTAQRLISQRTASLELIKGTHFDDTEFFAYVIMLESDANSFRKNGKMKLPANSMVICSGEGHNPSNTIEAFVLSEFRKFKKMITL